MTDQQHTTIVPRDLMRQWREEAPNYRDGGVGRERWLIERAAQWGADQRGEVNEAKLQKARDQELEATLAEVAALRGALVADHVRAARRPKPPSLKEQAYNALDTYIYGEPDPNDKERTYNIICRALNSLPD